MRARFNAPLTLAFGALLTGATINVTAQADGDTTLPLPPAAKEMAKLEPMLGHWTGKGIVIMEKGGQEIPWTSTSTIKKILGGHFVEETATIEMGMGVPMIFRTLQGWNAERKCFVAFSCSNQGSASTSDLFWTPDGKIVQSRIMMDDEDVITERWVTEVTSDEMSFVGYRAVNEGASFLHVKGTMKRHTKATVLPPNSHEMAMAPAPKQIMPCHKIAGTWNYEGWVIPAPGAPKLDVGGVETVETILGGHTVMTHVNDKTGYQDCSYMYWDAPSKTVRVFAVNNMGEINNGSAYFEDNAMLMGHVGTMRGRFMVGENRITMQENKREIVGRLLLDGKMVESMHMTMTRAKS